jgi:tetratricopeptide (TPR) repeat protein
MNQYDHAIVDFGRAIQLNPRYAKAYKNRGIAYKYKGQTDRAIADFQTTLKLDPSNSQATKHLKALGINP